MNPKNKKLIYVNNNDNDILLKYGFVKEGNSYYFYTGNTGKYGKPAYTIMTYRNTLNVMSCGNITLEVVCRLYKDGVIKFDDSKSIDDRIAKKEKQIAHLQAEIERLKRGGK